MTAVKVFEYDQNDCGAPAVAGARNGNDMNEIAEKPGWAG